MDDRRVGLVLRALRRRRGWRQLDVARTSGVSQSGVSRAELGHLDALSLRQVRTLASALDARVAIVLRWRGGEIDRLLDEEHSLIGATVAKLLRPDGWEWLPEVTFMRHGERGSFDMIAVRAAERVAAMFEFKSEFASAEETQRRFDGKRRVVASVVEERFGWRPRDVGAFLVLADTTSNRRRVAALSSLLRAMWPAGTRETRRWLRRPAGSLAGIWFLRVTRPRGSKRQGGGSHRVRRPGELARDQSDRTSGTSEPSGT